MVKVDEHELMAVSSRRAVLARLIDQSLHGADEARAIGKPGQRIMGGGMGKLALQAPATWETGKLPA
ncbi:hypothetical protein [Mesorhizobium sp. B3-2-1]|uniref:hypothetical protein n=1 Tax=Mesorhizobium sp. B3-2-1 TaxID=2589891 RepID=UPI001FEEA067|nr:hypothetical protein [Mesorhizobium sp. B3-2-1]